MPRVQKPVGFCECGDHAFTPATKGFMVMVSPEDAHLLLRNWKAHVNKKYGYVTIMSSNGGRHILARLIVRPEEHEKVDHQSGVTVDNRRPNLRVCTQKQNMWNARRRKRELPTGVTKRGDLFEARITHDGEAIRLGKYKTAAAAGEAYRAVALALRGEFARV